MHSFWFATSLFFIWIHFTSIAIAIQAISQCFNKWKENVLSSLIPSTPLTMNTGPLKAVLFVLETCSCESCIDVDLSEYLKFFYSTDGINYDEDLEKVQFDFNLKTLIIIHGFCDRVTLEKPFWMVSLAEVMVLTGGYKNVILVDYGRLCCNYLIVSGTVAPQMGQFIANTIVSMGLKPHLIDIVGYSLGAHVAGFVGATLLTRKQGKLNKIVALCKAAVNFDKTDKGLNASCASTVIDVISDNGNGIGSIELRGSTMYLMNSHLKLQPGCFLPTCNHEMCIHQFYAANHPDFFQNENQLRGFQCQQSQKVCWANVETSKLSCSSGKDTGCYCVNTPKIFKFTQETKLQ